MKSVRLEEARLSLLAVSSWSVLLLSACLGRFSFIGQASCSNLIPDVSSVHKGSSHCVKVNNNANKLICVCNETSCDQLDFDWPVKTGETYLVQTTKSGLRFESSQLPIEHEEPAASSKETAVMIDVDLSSEFQTILGFGGAFTDAAGININSLNQTVREHLLQSYFGPKGLQYTLGRVPIGGTDFSTRAYSYDDADDKQVQPARDYNLTYWKLAPEDTRDKIPIIKRAKELTDLLTTSSHRDGNLRLIASPWSPPKWMKTNGNLVRGHLIDEESMYQCYANYLIKFYKAYKEQGIEFWGATVQNEPIASYLPMYFFNSLQMGNDQMVKFIGQYLGPALERNGYTKDKFKLFVGDDSLGFANHQVPNIMKNEQVRRYVSGVAFHWYTSGLVAPYEELTKLVNSVKDHIEFVIMTEASAGYLPFLGTHVDLGSWQRGETYASDIINDLLRQTNAWIDWNLALNMEGGPNWSKNFVDSPIIVNSKRNEFYKQPMYYALAHFSRFLRPGSKRVATKLQFNKRKYFFQSDPIETVAVHNKHSGHLIVNILNKSSSRRAIHLRLAGMSPDNSSVDFRSFHVDSKSINTVVVKL